MKDYLITINNARIGREFKRHLMLNAAQNIDAMFDEDNLELFKPFIEDIATILKNDEESFITFQTSGQADIILNTFLEMKKSALGYQDYNSSLDENDKEFDEEMEEWMATFRKVIEELKAEKEKMGD